MRKKRVTAWTRNGQENQNWTLSKVGDWNAATRKGNLTQDENAQRYAWDVENRLVAAVVGAATNGYFYDYDRAMPVLMDVGAMVPPGGSPALAIE